MGYGNNSPNSVISVGSFTPDYTVVSGSVGLPVALSGTKDVLLLDGTYTLASNVTAISSNITIEGHKNTVIDGNSTFGIIVSNLQNVEFKNITFKNFTTFKLTNPVNITFTRCTFSDFTTYGVFLDNLSNVEFVKCKIDKIGNSSVNPSSQGCGIYAGGDTLIIHDCEISNTYGNGAIFIYGATNIYIKHNKIHDTFFRGVDFYSGTSSGLVDDNDIWNCGSINTTASGITCNGIYSSGDTYGVTVSNNRITNMLENGIEGVFKYIDNNTIESTGIDPTGHPTPSTEGIYPIPSSDGEIFVRNNKIRNSAGSGIKYYATTTIANMNIINNIIEDDMPNTNYFGIEVNSTVGYSNINIVSNVIKNKVRTTAVYMSNKPCTSCQVSGNKSINSGFSVPYASTLQTTDGSVGNIIVNREFSAWTDTTHLANWTVANGALAQVVDSNSNIPKLTNGSNGYATKLQQDIYLPKTPHIYYVSILFKGNDNFKVKLTPYQSDGITLNTSGASLTVTSSFSATNFQQVTLLLQPTYCKCQLSLEVATSIQGNYVIIQSILDKIIT